MNISSVFFWAGDVAALYHKVSPMLEAFYASCFSSEVLFSFVWNTKQSGKRTLLRSVMVAHPLSFSEKRQCHHIPFNNRDEKPLLSTLCYRSWRNVL